MKKIILTLISVIIVTTGVFACEGKYLVPKTKVIPKRSVLFEPEYAIDEDVSALEHQMFLEDLEDKLVTPVAVKPGQGINYLSQSRLPWVFGTMKQRDSFLSYLDTAISNGDQQKLRELLVGKNLSNITKFDENPLLIAIMLNKSEAIAPLAAAGANVAMQDKDGTDIINYAYKNSTPIMVEELLKAQQRQFAQSPKSAFFTRISPASIASVSPFCYNQDEDAK